MNISPGNVALITLGTSFVASSVAAGLTGYNLDTDTRSPNRALGFGMLAVPATGAAAGLALLKFAPNGRGGDIGVSLTVGSVLGGMVGGLVGSSIANTVARDPGLTFDKPPRSPFY